MNGTVTLPDGAANVPGRVFSFLNLLAQSPLKYTALASTTRVSGLTLPGGSRSVIFFFVDRAPRRLIQSRAISGVALKSAVSTTEPLAFRASRNDSVTGEPAWSQTRLS